MKSNQSLKGVNLMYNHENQYRCTIIRGKSQKEMDDLLPAYSKIIDEICPCCKDDFALLFNEKLKEYVPNGIKKTLDNHRTEIAGKLFGMYYLSEDGFVYVSERTNKFLADEDQPAFFKDMCFKMQFPNGMDKSNKIIEKIDAGISINQYPFLLKVLMLARDNDIALTKDDIAYYILNSLDVLTRRATSLEVIEQIKHDKSNDIVRKVIAYGKAASYTMQHINEQINYLELANLLIVDDKTVNLNMNEITAINIFIEYFNSNPEFDFDKYDLSLSEHRKQMKFDWDFYFSKLSSHASKFATSFNALCISEAVKPSEAKERINTTAIGDEGEEYVLAFEKERVRAFDPRLVGKVIHLGKTKGLGYDIQSVVAEDGDFAEFVKYIEVKATKRVTEPDITDNSWFDTINITRNEWVAACQHKESYWIFRVYFVRDNVIMYVLRNLYQKQEDGILKVVPMTYRVDFNNLAVDPVFTEVKETDNV